MPGSDALVHVLAQLGDAERLRAARIHPIGVLAALKTYAQGKGERGKATWTPVPRVVDALDAAFYASFQNVEPTGKRWLLTLDVSGSMGTGRWPVCPV
ncbi:MAG: TROVE domain-containing protein [Chloroflexota bacterium]|nr:TROVE domain-containing protein [Chloroflexota bacterium]